MPTRVPSFDHLPARWRASHARVVLDALSASGLTAAEFARRTGIPPKRLSRWGMQLGARPEGCRSAGRPLGSVQPARLVELVPTVALAAVEVSAAAPVALAAVEVRTPGGWQLRVPGELLVDLVGALAARSC